MAQTFDEVCERLDDLRIPGDSPFRIFFDGQEFEIDFFSVDTNDSTIHIMLEEA